MKGQKRQRAWRAKIRQRQDLSEVADARHQDEQLDKDVDQVLVRFKDTYSTISTWSDDVDRQTKAGKWSVAKWLKAIKRQRLTGPGMTFSRIA